MCQGFIVYTSAHLWPHWRGWASSAFRLEGAIVCDFILFLFKVTALLLWFLLVYVGVVSSDIQNVPPEGGTLPGQGLASGNWCCALAFVPLPQNGKTLGINNGIVKPFRGCGPRSCFWNWFLFRKSDSKGSDAVPWAMWILSWAFCHLNVAFLQGRGLGSAGMFSSCSICCLVASRILNS